MQVKVQGVYSKDGVHTNKALFILFSYIIYFFIYVFKSRILIFLFPSFFYIRASINTVVRWQFAF